MKLLVILSAILAMAASRPHVKTWTLQELSDAIELKKEPELQPYLEQGLNRIMEVLFSGKNTELVEAVILSPSGKATWTVEELTAAVNNESLNKDYKGAVLQAHGILQEKLAAGDVQKTVKVVIPAVDISIWTASELKEALDDSDTKPELIPYLVKAKQDLGESGKDTIGIVTPVGYVSHETVLRILRPDNLD